MNLVVGSTIKLPTADIREHQMRSVLMDCGFPLKATRLLPKLRRPIHHRIQLDKIAEYRQKLSTAKQISEPSSILILVGREDTGELEAQIRGSRQPGDMRLISIDALLKLVVS